MEAHKFMMDSSDEEEQNRIDDEMLCQEAEEIALLHSLQFGEASSRPTVRRRYTRRDRAEGGVRLYNDYFSEQPTFNDDVFRRRFRMRRSLFERILWTIHDQNPYFQQKTQCTGELGLTPYQKMTAAIRLLASGCAADTVDEYLRIAESTTYQCLELFCEAVVAIFSREYLREPNAADMARLLHENKERGFPGMIGSLDCMHWKWKNCPKAWAGSYTGYKGDPTIILEAVASYDLWFWHVFFGMPGSCNDINVLNRSGIFDRMMKGEAPPVEFVVNGRTYNRPYYLGDGIYPKLATIMKTIPQPRTPQEKNYAAAQESVRKDVERAFRVFQSRWGIIRQPARSWKKYKMHSIIMTCVILHNMIVEDERDIMPCEYDETSPPLELLHTNVGRYQRMCEEYGKIHDQSMHFQLKQDLMEHMWKEHGSRRD